MLFVSRSFSLVEISKTTFSVLVASQQYTLAVIRPDVYADGKVDEIVEKVG